MLEEIKVLDLSNFVFAPFCTQILGDLGAEVLKVETPQGDTMRQTGPSKSGQGMAPWFLACNRNKRSVVLDLHNSAARKALDAFITWADVIIHNIREDNLDALRLGYEDVRAVNDRIVYVHCVGYGSGGPYAGRPAFDQLIQAATGATYLMGQADGNPEPRFLPTLIADKTAALYAAYGVMGGIIHKLRTGKGQHIEVPMFESVAAYTMMDQLFGHSFDPPIGPIGFGTMMSEHQKPLKTKNGYICVLPYTNKQWAACLEAIGHADKIGDPRFATIATRTQHIDELAGMIRDAIPSKTTEEWMEIFDKAAIPASPATRLEDVVHDPHLRAVGMVTDVDHPSEGPIRMMGQPVRFSAYDAEEALPPRLLGEDTDDVLREFGFSDSEISEIAASPAEKKSA